MDSGHRHHVAFRSARWANKSGRGSRLHSSNIMSRWPLTGSVTHSSWHRS